jgi:hypothetical protein
MVGDDGSALVAAMSARDLAREFRDYASAPAHNGFVPIHPNTLRYAADEIERARKTTWLDIGSAPKDGTLVLLYRQMGQWDVRGYGYYEDCGSGVAGWVTTGLFEPPGNLGLAHPTHWLPLPEPPR